MKVLISADMEGTTGATCWNDVDPSKKAYQRFRKLLTGDVNAAIEGAIEAGAREVVVNEAHDGMRNILIEELNPKAQVITGFMGKRLCMIDGIDDTFNAAFLVAYHARAGTDAAIMNHTLLLSIHNLWINGVLVGEGGISSTIAGHYGVPVALVTGDDKVAKEMRELLGDVETAVTKYAIDRYTARCLTPQMTRERIKQAAKKALGRLSDLKPYSVDSPVKLEVEFTSASNALLASTVPSIIREGPRKISCTAEDPVKAWSGIWPSILVSMAAEDSRFARGIE